MPSTCRQPPSLHNRRSAGRVRVLLGAIGWPSGILDVASWIKHCGLAEPIVVSLPREDDSDALLVSKLREFRPHVVGFRLEGGQLEQIKQLVSTVRRHCHAEIVIGGPTATSHPGEVLEDTGADYVFAGEAEEPFTQFLSLAWQYNSKDLQSTIPGLAYRHGGRMYHNSLPRDGYGRTPCGQVRPVAPTELLAANRLDWSLLDRMPEPFDALYFTAGRGCPGQCAFCAGLHGDQVRVKSARQLLEEIESADARVTDGIIQVGRWNLFEHVAEPTLQAREVSWAAIYDEDFFLDRRRAVEFFRLWDTSPLNERYRISLQTNPRSLLTAAGRVHDELLRWIDRLKPMVQLGAESFNPELLTRWHKRHNVGQLGVVLNALDGTNQDYTVFQLLTDYDSRPEELIETLRLLVVGAYRHRRMRIASSPFTIPLYDSDTRRLLEFGRRLPSVDHFTDYERPHPEWMDPLAAELADLADAELQHALHLAHRDGALRAAMDAVAKRIGRLPSLGRAAAWQRQIQYAMDQISELRFQGT